MCIPCPRSENALHSPGVAPQLRRAGEVSRNMRGTSPAVSCADGSRAGASETAIETRMTGARWRKGYDSHAAARGNLDKLPGKHELCCLGTGRPDKIPEKGKSRTGSKRMLRAPGRQFFSDNPLTHHRTIRRLFSDKVQFRYLPRCSRRFLNLSTRPPESTNFCLPVKKGWHLEQMSTRSSPLASPFVERVVTVSPHAQRIVTSLY